MSSRPLSPHISIYRWPITMATSILHRATGIANSVGLIVLAAWLFNAAAGATAYAPFLAYLDSLPGKLLLIGWTFSFFYHLANGIRHLVWDAGHGFEISQANRSAWFVLILALLLTAAFWVLLS